MRHCRSCPSVAILVPSRARTHPPLLQRAPPHPRTPPPLISVLSPPPATVPVARPRPSKASPLRRCLRHLTVPSPLPASRYRPFAAACVTLPSPRRCPKPPRSPDQRHVPFSTPINPPSPSPRPRLPGPASPRPLPCYLRRSISACRRFLSASISICTCRSAPLSLSLSLSLASTHRSPSLSCSLAHFSSLPRSLAPSLPPPPYVIFKVTCAATPYLRCRRLSLGEGYRTTRIC